MEEIMALQCEFKQQVASTESIDSTSVPLLPLPEEKEKVNGKSMLECVTCLNTFTSPLDLQVHIRLHTGEKPYRCRICGERFISYNYLEKHIKSTHQKRLSSLFDSEPETEMNVKLKKQTTNDGVKRKRLNINRKKRNDNATKIVDDEEIAKDRPFMCSVCNRRFTEKRILTQHFRIHSGEKPYECKDCGRKFARWGVLYVHRRTHSGEKPYHCTKCSRRFITGGNLKAHILSSHSK